MSVRLCKITRGFLNTAAVTHSLFESKKANFIFKMPHYIAMSEQWSLINKIKGELKDFMIHDMESMVF